MPTPTIPDLMPLLLRDSKERRVQWEETRYDDNSYELELDSATIRLRNRQFVDGIEPAFRAERQIAVLNENGRRVESYEPMSDAEIRDFEQLFDLARHSALDTEEVMKALAKELEKPVKRKRRERGEDIPF